MAGLTIEFSSDAPETEDLSGYEALDFEFATETSPIGKFSVSDIYYQRVNSVVEAWGSGFHYQRVGGVAKFTQTGKIKSLRRVKQTIKTLESVGEPQGVYEYEGKLI